MSKEMDLIKTYDKYAKDNLRRISEYAGYIVDSLKGELDEPMGDIEIIENLRLIQKKADAIRDGMQVLWTSESLLIELAERLSKYEEDSFELFKYKQGLIKHDRRI